MAIYHCSIKIIGRSRGRSAVAAAAYRSGERLRDEETGLLHDFTRKGGVVYTEILLPENAPKEYADREILWNEVQKAERRSDAQLAREIEVALPKEFDRNFQLAVLHSYIDRNFVSKGMIADLAIHDKGDGNPHAHILLTVRGFMKNGKWDKKKRTVFANTRDEKGRPAFDPSLPRYDPQDRERTSQYRIPLLDENGKQKVRLRKGKGKEYLWARVNMPVHDWDDRTRAEEWRASWAEECNWYLRQEDQIDHRSYRRQGKDVEPTIHEGVAARQMEKKGRKADRCQINRQVREGNSLRSDKKKILNDLISLLMEKVRELIERGWKIRRKAGLSDQRTVRASGADAGDRRRDPGRERRIKESCRYTAETDREIDRTEQRIAETEQRVAETDRYIERVTEEILRREAEVYERYQRLRERREAFNRDGADTGSAGRTPGGERTAETGTRGSEAERAEAKRKPESGRSRSRKKKTEYHFRI